MNKLLSALVFLFLAIGAVSAQNQAASDYNKAEIFVGYSGASLYTGDDFEPIENGFEVAAVYNVHRYVGIKADFSGTYKKVEGDFYSATSTATLGRYRADHSLYNAAIGVQFKNNRRQAKVKPFAHVLVGYGKHADKFKTPCPSGAVCPPFNIDFTGVSLIVGGGLDIKVNRRIDVRAIQFDLNPIFYKSGGRNNSWDNTRFSSGIVFKF